MSREKESNDYDDLLSKLEGWTDALATRGPRGLPDIHLGMMEYLEFQQDSTRTAPDPEPCIDFEHQKNYE